MALKFPLAHWQKSLLVYWNIILWFPGFEGKKFLIFRGRTIAELAGFEPTYNHVFGIFTTQSLLTLERTLHSFATGTSYLATNPFLGKKPSTPLLRVPSTPDLLPPEVNHQTSKLCQEQQNLFVHLLVTFIAAIPFPEGVFINYHALSIIAFWEQEEEQIPPNLSERLSHVSSLILSTFIASRFLSRSFTHTKSGNSIWKMKLSPNLSTQLAPRQSSQRWWLKSFRRLQVREASRRNKASPACHDWSALRKQRKPTKGHIVS